MTKKHFEAIAAVISKGPDTSSKCVDADAYIQATLETDRIARELCEVFEKENPRFDRARFLKACGVTE